MNPYELLIQRLDNFIRRYYKNQLLRGAIYSVALIASVFIIVSALEYFGNFGSTVRAALFFGTIGVFAIILFRFVFTPLLLLFQIGKVISHRQAAQIIGNHFEEVQDQLLNVLELKNASGSRDLIEASIQQKASKLTPVPFHTAINFRGNLKYAKYALAPLALIAVITLTDYRSMFTESTTRIIDYKTAYVPTAPFEFQVNSPLEAVQGDDYVLEVSITGEQLPEKAYVVIGGNRFRLNGEGRTSFTHTFRNVREDMRFRFEGGGFESQPYDLKVLPNPVLLGFEIELDYPTYTGKKDETVSNIGDITVPEGTVAKWNFNTRNTEALRIAFEDTTMNLTRRSESRFVLEKRFDRTERYIVSTANEFVEGRDSSIFTIAVNRDQYPKITFEEQRDTADPKVYFFRGTIKDDYGFTRLTFNYRKADDETGWKTTEVDFNRSSTADQYYHYWDLNALNVEVGDEVEYYFQVWDNDGINGAKTARTRTQTFRAPTEEELKKEAEKNLQETVDKMEETMELAKDIQKEIDELMERMLQKKELSWEDKKRAEELMKKQKQLEKNIEEMKKQNRESNQRQEEYRQNEELIKKQKELENLMNELMDEEMKKFFEEMEKMMDELDKEKLQKQLDEMKLSNEELEKELDRNIELFKQMEVEQKLEETMEKLDQLKEEQKQLEEETKKGETSEEELAKKQEELNEKFEELQKDMDELQEKNSELEFPNEMPDTEQLEEEIEQEMQESKENLDKGDKQKSGENQKNAGDKMEEMSDQLQGMQNSMSMESKMEDMEDLRQLLDNLVFLSLEQERLMKEFGEVNVNDPKYVDLMREQNKIRDDARHIQDSLYALSKRVIEIEPFINEEMGKINRNMGKSIEFLAERKTNDAMARQQYVMTSSNNLALMLSEVMQQMQQQMSSMMQGTQSCEKPGGKPSMSEMMKMQQQMMNEMEEMMGQQKGQKEGGKQKGKSGRGGKMAEQYAKMAARQEALRKQLNEMMQGMENGPNGQPGGLGDAMEMMDEVERDLLNMEITEETLRRQEEILTRMLDHEKAEREREWDDKRESREGNQNANRPNPAFLEYQKMKSRQAELLKTVPPSLSPFYRSLVDNYFQKISE